MSVTLRAVESRKDLKKYINFPFSLYKDNPYWVPPLKSDELATLDPEKNPAFKYSDAVSWLAYKDGKLAGRITGIINHRYIETWNDRSARFGWVDFIDDEEVSKALFQQVEEWARDKGMESLHGPMGFTDMDEEGMLIEGFEELGTLPMIYNHSYYPKHMDSLGYKKDTDWIEYEIKTPDSIPEKVERVQKLVLKRSGLRLLQAKRSKDFLPYIGRIFDTLEKAYAPLYGAVPLTPEQVQFYTKQYFSFIEPDFTKVVLNEDDEVVAVGIAMPSLSRALQKAKGRIFPFGWIPLLKALKMPKQIDLYLVAVRPDYQNLGVNSILMTEITKSSISRGVVSAESSGELEDNQAVQNFWRHYDARQHKRRRSYRKGL